MNPESYKPELITPESIPKGSDATPSRYPEFEKPQETAGAFTPGERVTVERGGRNGVPLTVESDWIVEKVDTETGKVTVTSPDYSLVKTVSAEHLATLQAPFSEGQVVAVRRYIHNPDGSRSPGAFEGDWKVLKYDNETGTVVVGSADGRLEKTYGVDSLKAIQQQAAAEVQVATPEVSSELLHQVQQDLGEEAVEDAGVEVVAASRLINLDQQEQQKDPYDYLRTALPPVTRPEEPDDPHKYDHLFDTSGDGPMAHNPGIAQRQPETAEDRQRAYYDRVVTEANRNTSLATLSEAMRATPELRDILLNHDIAPTTLEAVDAIRENPDVRFEVAKTLVQKLDTLTATPNDMGWRINENSRNNLKVDPMTGARMSSRLYAVNMALKMIDGEFAERLEGKDDIQFQDGVVVVGQHRHAARATLMSYV